MNVSTFRVTQNFPTVKGKLVSAIPIRKYSVVTADNFGSESSDEVSENLAEPTLDSTARVNGSTGDSFSKEKPSPQSHDAETSAKTGNESSPEKFDPETETFKAVIERLEIDKSGWEIKNEILSHELGGVFRGYVAEKEIDLQPGLSPERAKEEALGIAIMYAPSVGNSESTAEDNSYGAAESQASSESQDQEKADFPAVVDGLEEDILGLKSENRVLKKELEGITRQYLRESELNELAKDASPDEARAAALRATKEISPTGSKLIVEAFSDTYREWTEEAGK